MASRADNLPPLDRALAAAEGLKAGSWESVMTLALLATAAQGRPEAAVLLEKARSAAAGLKAGSWESVRALAWIIRAEREAEAQ